MIWKDYLKLSEIASYSKLARASKAPPRPLRWNRVNTTFLLQMRAVRAITNCDYLAHSDPLFSDIKILIIFKINALQTAKFMFAYYHQNLPCVFSNFFITMQ